MVFLCAISVLSVSCMLSRAIIEQVFAALADRFRRTAEGMQEADCVLGYEPVAERWSLHPFSINPNSCLAP